MDGGTTESTGGGRRTIVEDLGSLERWWNASGIALWSFVLFGAFMLNATLLLAFLKRPGLRTISNRFVMNLTVSNLLTCAILNPLLMMDAPSSSASTSSTTCAIAESATALVMTSSVLSVLLIAIDQYLAVVDPLRYRTRIDKLKCAILVISVWLVSAIFALLAGFNPNPKSFWLVCEIRDDTLNENPRDINFTRNATFNVTIDTSLSLVVNASQDYNVDGEFSFTEFNENVRLFDNSTEILEETFVEDFGTSSIANTTSIFASNDFIITYGLIYALGYAIFAYLLPFVGVCWIYVSIYSAAHKNSERTRRTGSRPILSSGSFSEEYYPVRQDVSTEDFRRIPKISSLSSIDESIETLTPSQLMPRRGSEFLNHQQTTNETIEEEDTSPAVIFTVGSSKVDVTPQQQQQQQQLQQEQSSSSFTSSTGQRTNEDITKDNINDNKVPIAVLKAQFLGNTETARTSDDYVKSKFRDEPNQKRKSSYDLMYEEMLRKDLEKLQLGENKSDEESSDDENYENDERAFEIKNIMSDNHDIETGEIEDSTNCRITYDSLIVNNVENHETNEISNIDKSSHEITRASTSEPDIINDISMINDQLSTRKNSLEDSTNNLPSQSSIMKSQHGSFFNGKINSRSSYNFHRNDFSHISHYDETQQQQQHHQFYGKSSTGNLESHVFGTSSSTPIVTITPPKQGTSLQRVSSVKSTSSYINSLKHRISNGSLFKYREETRAARISALVIVMGLVCWTPYVIVLLLKNLTSITGKRSSHESDVASLSFLILAAYISPLLFGYRSRRVKRELRKFFCFRKELSYKNNRSLMAKKVLKRRHSGNFSQVEMDARYNIFNCVYGRTRWPKDKVQFVQVPETALVVETCRSSFSSGASTQISSTSTEEC